MLIVRLFDKINNCYENKEGLWIVHLHLHLFVLPLVATCLTYLLIEIIVLVDTFCLSVLVLMAASFAFIQT